MFVAVLSGETRGIDQVSFAVNNNNAQRCLIVSCYISDDLLNDIISSLRGKHLLFSECTPTTDFTDVQVLVIDFLGAIPQIFRYCRYAYIGDGLSPHDVGMMEAATCHIPVACTPKIYRKIDAQVVRSGRVTMVKNGKDLEAWLKKMRHHEDT